MKGIANKMKLVDKTIKEFSKELSSANPAPGGGSTAALQGVLGVSLMEMVASLTIGRKKYSDYDTLMKDIVKRVRELRKNLLDIIDRDTDAFNQVSAVFALPKTTDDEIELRNDTMQTALKNCTLIPFEVMHCAHNALELSMVMLGKYNTNTISDLGVAVLSLRTAAEAAWLNVLVNLKDIRDEIFTAKYMIAGNELMQRIEDLADDIHEDILNSLYP